MQVWDESNGGRGKVTDKVDLATYLHRSGRCARFTNKGVSLCFYTAGTAEGATLAQVEAAYCDHMEGGVMEEVKGDALSDVADLLGDD